MGIKERLAQLRKKMEENQVDLYFVPTNDFHGSEYISDYFKGREFLTGFDGSAGSVIVTKEEAGLWTDGRYFLQAEAQLAGTEVILHKSGQEGVPTVNEYINKNIPQGGVLGIDGRMVSAAWAEGMREMLGEKQARLRMDLDLVGQIWQDRPSLVHEKAWLLSVKYTGTTRMAKLDKLRHFMQEAGGSQMVLTALDDIAWLLNIRGNDIPCNPVVLSYLVVRQKDCILFAGEAIFTEEARRELESDGILLRRYEEIYEYLETLVSEEVVLVDKQNANAIIVEKIPEEVKRITVLSPIVQWKAVKNPVEIENEKTAHIRDGVAVTKFICWLKQNIDKMPLTEIKAAEKLESFRKKQKNYLGPSFEPIAGYAEHGAIVHYSATPETDARLLPENFLLLDTGGQYLEGTTDITRTILLGGKATKEQKKYYTAVLRGNLNLMAAKFMYGCSGVALDYAARQPLWEMGCDYNHGTGHGVGYLLNVHEAPNAFRYRILKEPGQNAVLEEGMITSNEPGIYLAGKYGIRLENLILCVKKEKNEFGQFMGFEPLTFVPFDREAIDVEQMSPKELALLNAYHQQVYDHIAPYLSCEEKEWLADICAPL